MRKLFLLFALTVGLLASATLQAQTVNMNRYITLTVTDGAAIKLDFKAAAAGTPVRIVSGSNTQNITVGTDWIGTASYTADGTTMTVYGDLTDFDCRGNGANLTAIDVSHNTQLTYLDCSSNPLSSLDVSKNTQLTKLICSNNRLTSLDVSKNTQLEILNCSSNSLTTLDVSKNTRLTELYCFSNQLTTLDVSKNTKLKELSCPYNQLTTLDVSNNTQLTQLWCYSNQLTTLDVSKNTRLNKLYCSSNQLTTLDVSKNTQLTILNCSSNSLTTLDVSKNTQLNGLACDSNSLTSLDVSKNTWLTELHCWGNNFTTAALDAIYCTLPARISLDSARIFPLHESSSVAEQNMVASTNAANATAKNWQVLKFKEDGDNTHIATTGSYVCSGGSTTVYDLRIAGVQVTSANCSDLSVIPDVSGTVKYDPSTKTLTLQNATIQTNTYAAIVSNIDGLTIKVIGTNNLTSTMAFYNTATITGGGTLNVEIQNHSAIYVNETNLTIDGCNINAKGKYGITGNYGSSDTLTIKNSTVTAEGTAGSITDFASLTLDSCAITQPVRAAFYPSLHAVALGDSIVTSKVVISPTGSSTTTYDLLIAGVQVTSANCSDLSVISGVTGTVKYDPTNKVITLDGATIQINTSNAINSKIVDLTVKVIGTNNLTSTVAFHNTATITGGGTLNVEIHNHPAIYVNETNLTIDGCTVNAKGKYGITGNDGSSETLTIKNSTVTAEGASQGSIVDFAGLTLDGCAITQPSGAAFDASLKAVALGGAKVTSKVVISPTEPNMSRYITLTVAKDSAIKFDFKAAAEGTPVRIVSGNNTQNITVGTSWKGTTSYTAVGTEIKVYGDITNFDCQYNGANLTALDVSHNTQLTVLWCLSNLLSSLDISKNTQLNELYCWDNKFSTQALDDIYCALPVRSASDNAKIVPVESASAPNHATVLATNAQNATAKNWKVLYAEDNADVPTTGSYDCSTAVAEASAEPALTLYPNPVADVLYLSSTARTIRIYNIYGTEVAHATDTDKVEVSHLPAGIYTVRADGTVAKMVKR